MIFVIKLLLSIHSGVVSSAGASAVVSSLVSGVGVAVYTEVDSLMTMKDRRITMAIVNNK